MKVTISNVKKRKSTLADISHRKGATFVSSRDIENDDVRVYIVIELWTNQRVKVLDLKDKDFDYLPAELVIEEVQIDSMCVTIKNLM